MKAVIIGAGRVACGFLGSLLSESGYEVILVGRRPEVVVKLNRGRYLIETCHADGSASIECVEGVRSILLRDENRLKEALAGARLVFTAVGASGLGEVTGPLAKALVRNLSALPSEGVDIISCENMPNAIALIRQAVADNSSPDQWETVERLVHFRRAMVWRIISDRCLTEDNIRLRADDIERIDIEAPRGRPSLPPIKGAVAQPNMAHAIHEKLYLFNTGHAVAAYLGYLHGFQFVHDALQEPCIGETVARALEEASVWPGSLGPEESSRFVQSCLSRYANPALRDRTVRVAARPLQKLGPFERLVLPAWHTLTAGGTPLALADAIAAALRFDNWQDAEGARLQRLIATQGVRRALEGVSGLRPSDELTQIVAWQFAAQGAAVASHRNGHKPSRNGHSTLTVVVGRNADSLSP